MKSMNFSPFSLQLIISSGWLHPTSVGARVKTTGWTGRRWRVTCGTLLMLTTPSQMISATAQRQASCCPSTTPACLTIPYYESTTSCVKFPRHSPPACDEAPNPLEHHNPNKSNQLICKFYFIN